MGIYVVIDIGTSSMRAVLYNTNGEKRKQIQFTNSPMFKQGKVEQNVKDWDRILDKIMIQVVNYLEERNETLKAIFLTSQRSSLICLDQNNEPLIPAIMWQDKRCSEITKELGGSNDVIIKKTGAPLNPVYLAPKIAWVKRNLPDIATRTKKYLSVADYIGFLITGDFYTDYTYASRTSIFNIHENKWDEELLTLFGVQKKELCELIPPGIAGRKASNYFNEKYGIKNEIDFVSSGGDQQCSAVGMGILDEGSVAISIGTGGYILGPSNKVASAPQLIVNTYPIDSLYILEAILPACSSAMDWIGKNLFEQMPPNEFYEVITNTLESEHETSVIHLPHFQGRGTPDWNNEARAAFLELDFSTTKRDMLLAMVESIAIELKNNISVIESIGQKSIEKVVIAGGLSNNDAINQLISNVLGIKIIKAADSEATALGALAVGMKALNKDLNLRNFLNGIQQSRIDKEFTPDIKKNDYYRVKGQKWNELYNKINS